MSAERIPHAKEAERHVIHRVIMEPYLFADIQHMMPDHFLDQVARSCFEQMQSVKTAGREFVMEDFAESDQTYLITNGAMDGMSLYLTEYIRRIETAYELRTAYNQMIEGAKAAIRGDVDAIRNWRLEMPVRRDGSVTLAEAASKFMDELKTDGGVVKTGFRALDYAEMLHRKELIVLAARPSMGKSQLAFQIGYNVASTGGVVLIASLEMAAALVAGRIAQAISGYGSRDRSEPGLVALADASVKLMSMGNRLVIMDQPMTTLDVYSEARRIQAEVGLLDLIVTDHLRLFDDRPDLKEDKRLGIITKAHKNMAKEFNCPVLAAAQLSRAVEYKAGNKPDLSDLRDSGQIEEDADVVAFIYRDAYYQQADSKNQSGVAQVYSRKVRNGEHFNAEVFFDAKRGGRFADLAPTYQREVA